MSSIKEKRVLAAAVAMALAAFVPLSAWSAPFDLVIRGGRVLDPEQAWTRS